MLGALYLGAQNIEYWFLLKGVDMDLGQEWVVLP